MRNLQQILSLAERHGKTAVIHGQSVAIFTPTQRDLGRGVKHVSFQIDQVRTVEQAHAVLDGGRFWRRAKSSPGTKAKRA